MFALPTGRRGHADVSAYHAPLSAQRCDLWMPRSRGRADELARLYHAVCASEERVRVGGSPGRRRKVSNAGDCVVVRI
eukprot:4652265-Prymnesium_polylepis.1